MKYKTEETVAIFQHQLH